jgi:arylsulfatase
VGTPTQHRISLDPWAGQTVTLELQTLPGETDDLDYVFLTDPVIFVPRPDPARVLIVFIDTLRADHMTIYGHDKATTPKLEAWAQRAAVFENARSVAPWTLPSARTLVTGAVPERWGKVPTLSDQVRDAGWATSFIVGNVYLSSNFGLSEGWGEHRAINWPSADVQVSRALDFLKAHPDRPSLQIVHFMDTHLPYSEPRRYRNLFAGETPEQLGDDTFHHKEVKKAASAMGAEGKQYIRDRYDNNLRVVDDEVWRLLDAMPEDSLVVIMSDHGEEFWEHGGLEHGHSLYDELLHVPLIVKGPGIEAGRFAEPTSLLDIAPTIAQHLGLSQSGMDGWPLQDLIDGSRQSDFADRALAFGRPLYGTRRWGVLWDGHKYMVHEGRERLHDLRTDGAEQTNLRKADTDIEPWLAAMAKGMKTEVSMGFRLHATAKKSPDPLVVHLEIPGGVRTAVVGEDYLRRSEVSIEIIEGAKSDTLIATWAANKAGTREVFIVPEGPLELAAAGARLTVVAGDAEGVARPSSPLPPLTDGRGRTLMTARAGGRSVSLKPMAVPLPLEGSVELAAVDDEMAAELEALGYLDGSE